MFEYRIWNNTVLKIDDFIDSYLHSNINLFVDSWIDNVWEIIKNYENFAFKFRDLIYKSIDNIFIEEKIFWYKILINKNYEITIPVWNYRFFIEYFEKSNIRYLSNIKIYKK